MKQKFYFFAILSLILFTNYSFNNSSSTLSPLEQKLIGKWYFTDPSLVEGNPNNSFTFTSDKKVTYKYWNDKSHKYKTEKGTFTGKRDELIMTIALDDSMYIEYHQKVIFLNDERVQFVAPEEHSNFVFDGYFYKAK
jgi:hypothetical protein